MATIGSRLTTAREEMGFSREKLAALGGVSYKTQGKYERDESAPDAEYLAAIAHAVDIQYVITGERSLRPQSQRSIVDAQLRDQRGGYLADDLTMVPRYQVEISAGHGSQPHHREEVLDYMAFRRAWLRDNLGIEPDKAAIVFARGDSMEPNIHDGDPVIIDTGWETLDDGVYVLRLDDHTLLKRIQNLMDGTWLVKSDNPVYDSITLNEKQVHDLEVIGRARYTYAGRRL